jgi:hypothetical protein
MSGAGEPVWTRPERFESATIVLPVVNEVESLKTTVDIIMSTVGIEDIRELLVVVCSRTIPESRAAIQKLRDQFGELVVIVEQRLPFLGGAFRDSFELARGSHVLIMSTDLETDPNEVKSLIGEARGHPQSIVTASRWIAGGKFRGYSLIKLVCNWAFQRMFSALYGVRLTDMTFGFRIFPTNLVRSITWEELRHPFCLECLVKPLRLGVEVREIACVWRARSEGESQNSFFRNFAYFRTGLKVRFANPRTFLLNSSRQHRG